MTTYTKVAKPSTSAYTAVNPGGKEQYDQASLTYDNAVTFYDGVNPSQYTNVAKPATSNYTFVAKPSNAIVIDNFDSYTNGLLSGQGGWIVDNTFTVQSSVVYQGTKAASASGITGKAYKVIPTTANAVFTIYNQVGPISGVQGYALFIGDGLGNSIADIFLANEVAIFETSSGTASIGSYTGNTWYSYSIQIDGTDSLVRGRVNNGPWSSWFTILESDVSSVGFVGFGAPSPMYWDYLTYEL